MPGHPNLNILVRGTDSVRIPFGTSPDARPVTRTRLRSNWDAGRVKNGRIGTLTVHVQCGVPR